MTPDLQPFINRVRGASGADEAYDRIGYDVTVALLGREEAHRFLFCDVWRCRNPAASLDATLELCARVLPGWFRGLGEYRDSDTDPEPRVWIANVYPERGRGSEAEGKTPALALLLAMLNAVQGGKEE